MDETEMCYFSYSWFIILWLHLTLGQTTVYSSAPPQPHREEKSHLLWHVYYMVSVWKSNNVFNKYKFWTWITNRKKTVD